MGNVAVITGIPSNAASPSSRRSASLSPFLHLWRLPCERNNRVRSFLNHEKIIPPEDPFCEFMCSSRSSLIPKCQGERTLQQNIGIILNQLEVSPAPMNDFPFVLMSVTSAAHFLTTPAFFALFTYYFTKYVDPNANNN